MLKNILSFILVCSLFSVTAFAQISNQKSETFSLKPKLTREDFMKYQSGKFDFKNNSREIAPLPSKRKLSKGAKMGIWAGVIAGAAVVTGLIIWKSTRPDRLDGPNFSTLPNIKF